MNKTVRFRGGRRRKSKASRRIKHVKRTARRIGSRIGRRIGRRTKHRNSKRRNKNMRGGATTVFWGGGKGGGDPPFNRDAPQHGRNMEKVARQTTIEQNWLDKTADAAAGRLFLAPDYLVDEVGYTQEMLQEWINERAEDRRNGKDVPVFNDKLKEIWTDHQRVYREQAERESDEIVADEGQTQGRGRKWWGFGH